MDDLSEGEVAEAFGGPIFGAWRSNVEGRPVDLVWPNYSNLSHRLVIPNGGGSGISPQMPGDSGLGVFLGHVTESDMWWVCSTFNMFSHAFIEEISKPLQIHTLKWTMVTCVCCIGAAGKHLKKRVVGLMYGDFSIPTLPNRNEMNVCIIYFLPWFNRSSRWSFQIFFIITPKIGEDEPILTCAYFSNGLGKNHQPVIYF